MLGIEVGSPSAEVEAVDRLFVAVGCEDLRMGFLPVVPSRMDSARSLLAEAEVRHQIAQNADSEVRSLSVEAGGAVDHIVEVVACTVVAAAAAAVVAGDTSVD